MKRPNRKDYIGKKSKIQLIADLELYIDYLENTMTNDKLKDAAQFAIDAIAHFLVENRSCEGQLNHALQKLEKAVLSLKAPNPTKQ